MLDNFPLSWIKTAADTERIVHYISRQVFSGKEVLRRRLVFIPPWDKDSLISQEYWLRVNQFIKRRQFVAPGFLLLKQSIFHHVNHITTDPLWRTRFFTVSRCQRQTGAPLGERGLRQYLAVAQISKKVQTRRDPGNSISCFPDSTTSLSSPEWPRSLTSKADGIIPIYWWRNG